MEFDVSTLTFLFLYAETHFRFFRFFPSFLYKKIPEIIFDMPKRIDSGKNVPLMLICNDTDRFPITVLNVSLSLSQKGTTTCIFDSDDCEPYRINHPFEKQSQVFVFMLDSDYFESGEFSINGKATIRNERNGRESIILNDNLQTSSKSSLTAQICKSPLPGHEWSIFGDLHVHSQFSRSHVEFGTPISVIDSMAFASGLSFVGITDHSYDLACTMDNYLKPDPKRGLWHSLQQDIRVHKKKFQTTLILGEEISSCNRKKRVVHLGALGLHDFIPGSKDGARKQIDLREEPDLPEAITIIKQQKGICFAAHPGAESRLMQKLLLKRGVWDLVDIHEDLHAMQVLNGGFTNSWRRGQNLWITMLLQKRKLALIAGNDAHGDFNRYRAIGIPFFSVKENFSRYFSYSRTGIYGIETSEQAVLDAIKNGKTFITNGPFIGISKSNSPADSIISKVEISGKRLSFFIHAASSTEFGMIKTVQLIQGDYQTKKEQCLHSLTPATKTYYFSQNFAVPIANVSGYIRASVRCLNGDGRATMAFTSPCYFSGLTESMPSR